MVRQKRRVPCGKKRIDQLCRAVWKQGYFCCFHFLTVKTSLGCNKIFIVIVTMYKMRNSFDIISLQNEQCSCFGSSKQVQEQFLAKQKTLQPTPIPNSHNKNNLEETPLPKTNYKKSLKKQFMPLWQNGNNKTNLNMNSNEIKPAEPTPKTREIRQFLSPQGKNNNNYKTFVIAEEPINPFYSMKVTPKQMISCQNIQQTISPFQSYNPHITNNSPSQQPAMVKIKHQQQKNEQNPLTTYQSSEKRDHSPISNKSINRQRQTVCSTIQPEQTVRVHLEPSEPGHTQINRIKSKVQLHEFIPPKQEVYKSCVKFATMKSIISPSKAKNQTLKSRIDTGKSGIVNNKSKNDTKKSIVQTNRSRIQIKSLRMQKHSLKKMDDVIEIYSLPDSEEASDSDKESVVLGRLNEYGSMIDPQISHTSVIQEKVQNKLVRINSVFGNFGEDDWRYIHDDA